MKTKEIYKVEFSGLYIAATLKAELEPHPHLVKLNQVGKSIRNFNGYWYFHVWVEAKSKKAAIRKGAVQIMEWLEMEGRLAIPSTILGTIETLLEQKATWEVLKAEEEAKEDTAPEDEAPFGDPQSDASSDASSGASSAPANSETGADAAQAGSVPVVWIGLLALIVLVLAVLLWLKRRRS